MFGDWRERRDRVERADGQADAFAVRRQRGDDGDAGGEAAEGVAEGTAVERGNDVRGGGACVAMRAGKVVRRGDLVGATVRRYRQDHSGKSEGVVGMLRFPVLTGVPQ